METRNENPHKPMDEIVGDGFDEFRFQQGRNFQDARNNNRLDETTMEEQSASDESSEPASSSFNSRSPRSSKSSVPPRAEEWDRTIRHIGLEDFGKALENAAKAVYPNGKTSRYSRVYVLLMCWETQDPKIPVDYEIRGLRNVLEDVYNYEVEEFRIPDLESHAEVSEKINSFVKVGGNSNNDLKIVYYAGHSKLSRSKELVWSILPEKKNVKCPIVVWSGIQRSLETTQSDVLILLDCCSSGVAHASEGNAITEVICAFPFDSKANGVGRYSFTHALTTELRLLSKKLGFSVGELYTAVYTRMQSFLAQGIENERYPPPVHFAFIPEESFRKGILLSIHSQQVPDMEKSGGKNPKRPSFEDTDGLNALKKRRLMEESSNLNTEELTSGPDGSNAQTVSLDDTRTSKPPQNHGSSKHEKPCQKYRRSVPEDSLYPLDTPRVLFAVRFKEDIKAEDLSLELFKDRLRAIPAAVEEICIEGSFKCFSTLVFITLPLSMRAYILDDPAIFYLGTILSSMILPPKKIKLGSSQTKEELTPRTVRKDDIEKSGLAPSGNLLARDKIFQFPPQQRGRSNSLTNSIGDLANKLGKNGNGLTNPTFYKLFDSQTFWDDHDDFLDSQGSSSAPFEQDPWSNAALLRPSSGNCSPRDRSPGFGATWSGLSPRGSQDYSGLSKPYEDHIYSNTYENAARKPLYTWRPHSQTITPAASSEYTDEPCKLVGRSSLELDNTARDHPLYHNVTPKADGLYHCPFEEDPKSKCMHKPEKLKCNYDKFVDSHLKPYKCKVNTCKDLCFSSTACLLRHEREAHAMHGHGDKPFLCNYEGCERNFPGNGFPRHWNLRDHLKRVHNDTGNRPKSNASVSPPPSSPVPKGKKRKSGDNSGGIITTSSETMAEIGDPKNI